jgi:3'-5' exoribonuclease
MLVKEIQAEGRVSGFFLILDSQWRVAKNGTPYATLRLGDKTGEIAMKVWELSKEVFNELKTGTVIKVEATAKHFNGSLQLEAGGKDRFFQICQGNQYDPALFLRTTELESEALWSVLDQACAEVELPCYQALLKHFFTDGEFRKRFERSPAALRHHHAYLGGLLEHTVGVTKICLTVATYYPRVHKDLLITGALLHDVGKLESYQVGPGLSGTDQGRLIGHLILGIQMVAEAITGLRSIQGADFFPPECEWSLLHLLASHHGIKDWGSPVEPASLEACILHHADYLDSDISKYLEALRKHPADGGNWTSYDQNLQKSVYLPFLPLPQQAAEEELRELHGRE